MKKSVLTFAEHVEIGQELYGMSEHLTSRWVQVANAYPQRAPQVRELGRALDALRAARSSLDSQLARDYPGQFAPTIYYPGAQKVRNTPPAASA